MEDTLEKMKKVNEIHAPEISVTGVVLSVMVLSVQRRTQPRLTGSRWTTCETERRLTGTRGAG
jgi:hypothetical protein